MGGVNGSAYIECILRIKVTYANFHLLGDPALTLHYPKFSVQTTSINGKTLSNQFTDTLGGLQTVTIAGQVSSSNGQIINNYNGLVYTTVFDREKKVNCLVNTPESALYVDTLGTFTPFQFILQKDLRQLYLNKILQLEFLIVFLNIFRLLLQ